MRALQWRQVLLFYLQDVASFAVCIHGDYGNPRVPLPYVYAVFQDVREPSLGLQSPEHSLLLVSNTNPRLQSKFPRVTSQA